ncbi:putative pyridoxal kinase isoform X2 [Varroa jacobsoni]|nr:putative pyridoxal kinase isoform X2 [Varroa jacobsoni]
MTTRTSTKTRTTHKEADERMSTMPRVLSIQSHVVRGYAGNRCAVFPLQTLGFEVDFINSVQFSNHTGYPVTKGTKVSQMELRDLFEGLKLNKVTEYSHVITGYVVSVDFLRELANIVKDIKEHNKDVVYLCDPVLGDHGSYYVPQELTDEYRSRLLPLCDILTPNQFELGELTGLDVKTEEDAIKAIERLHDLGVSLVVLTSAIFTDRSVVTCIASRRKDGNRCKFEIPWQEGNFVGTGDLFAALILAWTTNEECLEKALLKALSTVQGILQNTVEFSKELKAHRPDLSSAAFMELRLVQSRQLLIDPPLLLSANKI